jgi:very-short-patch-repair endonuclease
MQGIPDTNLMVQMCTINTNNTTMVFIEKARLKHGDMYDYSKVDYVLCNKKIIIICKTHGEFLQLPSNHLWGYGCRQCSAEKCSKRLKSCTSEFIQNAKIKHGDLYDYSKVLFVSSLEKVIIICKIHGEYQQQPSLHLYGRGCHHCGIKKCANSKRLNTQKFIESAKTIHGTTYDYSMVDYISFDQKVTIICKIHCEYQQTPTVHLSGSGCNLCGLNRRAKKRTSNTEKFIQKSKTIHGETYDYNKVDYSKAIDNVIIICKTHGEFLQSPNKHMGGKGCPYCVNKTEGKLYEKLKILYPSITPQFKQEWCMKKKYDFCIPEYNIIIELDGLQHFKQVSSWKSPEETFANDKYKQECANDNNYSMIRLLQDDVWFDKYDWCKELCDAIESIQQQPAGETVTNIYLCKNNEYCQYLHDKPQEDTLKSDG